jgi:hypothetical protein
MIQKGIKFLLKNFVRQLLLFFQLSLYDINFCFLCEYKVYSRLSIHAFLVCWFLLTLLVTFVLSRPKTPTYFVENGFYAGSTGL